MLARSLGLSKTDRMMRRITNNVVYKNFWFSKSLTTKTTKLPTNYGSNKDKRGSEAEFSLHDPNCTMWRSITADNVELEQKPTDQTANIHNYYKDRWLQEQRDGRLDVADPKKCESSSGEPSIYRQLAKKQLPIDNRRVSPRVRVSSGFTMDGDEHGSTGHAVSRVRESPTAGGYASPPPSYPQYDKVRTESIGMPTSGSFTVSSFKVVPDQTEVSAQANFVGNNSQSPLDNFEDNKGMSWEISGEPAQNKKRSSGNEEKSETTCFSTTTAFSPNFKLASGQ